MDEKILIQYRYADDEKYQKSKKILPLMLIVGVIGLLLFFVLKDAESPMNATSIVFLWIGGYSLLMSLFMYPIMLIYGKMSITVTTHRVYGRVLRSEENLPIDSISSTGKSGKKRLYVTTPSGKVVFAFYTAEKMEEVYQVISQQISNRQNNKGSVVVMNSNSTPDELKKYKDLLDSGVITQEEFDAKKKQMLGL